MPTEDVFTVTTHHLSASSFSQYQHLTQRTLLDVSCFTILLQNVHKSAKNQWNLSLLAWNNHTFLHRGVHYTSLYHATENTANQNTGKLLYIQQYYIQPPHHVLNICRSY